jgi:hypothetical protein
MSFGVVFSMISMAHDTAALTLPSQSSTSHKCDFKSHNVHSRNLYKNCVETWKHCSAEFILKTSENYTEMLIWSKGEVLESF